MPSADLLLHPLRLRIVQTFLGERQLTTGQLLAEIDGIPPATLYRQVATLARAGVLTVVGERQVRGTVERTYALSVQDAQLTDEDLRDMTPEDHRHAFMAFLAGLLADVDRYIDAGDVDLVADGAGYRTIGLWLTRDELTEMVTEIGAAVQARAANAPAPGRTRRMLSTVLIPAPTPPAETDDPATADAVTADTATPDTATAEPASGDAATDDPTTGERWEVP
jgi:DNA-binding transcriptional ArsR family regulator